VTARHHLVPQFYLRNFADGNGQVALVDRDDPERVILNAVRKACSEVGFYRIETEVLAREEDRVSHDPESVEQHLSMFEQSAAPAIYKLLRTAFADFTRDDWFHMINFIALQTVRGHRWREDFNALATQAMRVHLGATVTDETIAQWLRDEGRPVHPTAISDYREQMVGPDRPRLIAPDAVHIQEGFKLALGDLGERLADDMRWSLIASDSVQILTSDEPVCWWAAGNTPVGYGSAQVVWLPLNPRVVLQLMDADVTTEDLGLPSPSTPSGRDELCRFINSQVGGQAHRWIVHRPGDRPLDDVILAPRTAWGDELVSVEETGNTRREIWVHRRLPAVT
jgi:hypothetical protein